MRIITFGSGVVETIVTDTPNQRDTARVTTTDGTTTCYTVPTTSAAGGLSVVWQNPAGATVATGVVNKTDNYLDVTCAGGGTAHVTDVGACFGVANACTVAL